MEPNLFARLGDFHRLGFEPPSSPNVIPPDPDYTTWVGAGALTIGVEARILPGEEATFKGPSIHVCNARDGSERLRFDVFDGLPHYHYILPGISDNVVAYDHAACGDMLAWTVRCLGERLPEMLRQADADELASDIDLDVVRSALPAIIDLATTGSRTNIPDLPEWVTLARRS